MKKTEVLGCQHIKIVPNNRNDSELIANLEFSKDGFGKQHVPDISDLVESGVPRDELCLPIQVIQGAQRQGDVHGIQTKSSPKPYYMST